MDTASTASHARAHIPASSRRPVPPATGPDRHHRKSERVECAVEPLGRVRTSNPNILGLSRKKPPTVVVTPAGFVVTSRRRGGSGCPLELDSLSRCVALAGPRPWGPSSNDKQDEEITELATEAERPHPTSQPQPAPRTIPELFRGCPQGVEKRVQRNRLARIAGAPLAGEAGCRLEGGAPELAACGGPKSSVARSHSSASVSHERSGTMSSSSKSSS
jgi:hypothetical protein